MVLLGTTETQGVVSPPPPLCPSVPKNVALCLSMDLSYLCLFSDLNIEPNSENPVKALQRTLFTTL